MGTGATLSAGSVEINGGILTADGPAAVITAKLFYSSSSASTYQGILTGAGNSLSVENPLAELILSGTGDSYTGGTFVTAGELVVTRPGGIESGTSLGVGSDLTAFGAVVPGESVSGLARAGTGHAGAWLAGAASRLFGIGAGCQEAATKAERVGNGRAMHTLNAPAFRDSAAKRGPL